MAHNLRYIKLLYNYSKKQHLYFHNFFTKTKNNTYRKRIENVTDKKAIIYVESVQQNSSKAENEKYTCMSNKIDIYQCIRMKLTLPNIFKKIETRLKRISKKN